MFKPAFWIGEVPKTCQLCRAPITETFIDGRTRVGAWAFMCPTCHAHEGGALGLSNGQQYTKQDNDLWMKTKG